MNSLAPTCVLGVRLRRYLTTLFYNIWHFDLFFETTRKPGNWRLIKITLNQSRYQNNFTLILKKIVLRKRHFALLLLLMLLLYFLAIYSPDKCWSNYTPRYLIGDLAAKIVPPKVTFSWNDTLRSFLVAKQDRFSLIQMKRSLLSVSQLIIYSNSLVNFNSISFTSFPGTIRAESSAYSSSLQLTAEDTTLT